MTTHHYPAEPGSTRSLVAPHMHVLGDERQMLSEDLQLTVRILGAHEADLDDALITWRHCHGAARSTHRAIARLCVERVRRWRRENRNALKRLALYRAPKEEPSC